MVRMGLPSHPFSVQYPTSWSSTPYLILRAVCLRVSAVNVGADTAIIHGAAIAGLSHQPLNPAQHKSGTINPNKISTVSCSWWRFLSQQQKRTIPPSIPPSSPYTSLPDSYPQSISSFPPCSPLIAHPSISLLTPWLMEYQVVLRA